MPVIKVQHICSFSSEDPNHPASNLLSSETYRKWKCASAGEKQVVVVLQLETPTQIHSVDVGNEGSAFVEVLVGRSSDPDNYQVLLVASAFMSPTDSRAWNNTNRVRMFGCDKLSKAVVEQKWDRVKVVCTQPYNKKEKYGLSFITLHSPPSEKEEEEEKKATPTKKHIGAFALKEEPKNLQSGSFFFKKDSPTATAASTAAAQARSATTAALKADQSGSPRGPDTAGAAHRVGEGGVARVEGKKRKAPDDHVSSDTPSKKPKASASGKDDSLSKIMHGVVFTLSGFKNPFRGDLREKAIQMGALYEPDWGPKCTHLVCAFSNTPKFNQVKAKRGLIVKKEWITESYVKKRRLPASKYRLSGGSGDSSSEDEFYDKKEKDIFKSVEGEEKARSRPTETKRAEASTAAEERGAGGKAGERGEGGGADEDDPYGGSTDEGSDMDTDVVVKKKPLPPDSSECDTEDEIQRVKAEQDDPYAGTTEEESDKEDPKPSGKSLANLPDLFSSCWFMLYGNFSPADRRLVERYITAYNGHIEDYMSNKVTHVVTLESWDANFDQALEDNSNLTFVRPQWIFKCHEKQSRVPYQPYAVVLS